MSIKRIVLLCLPLFTIGFMSHAEERSQENNQQPYKTSKIKKSLNMKDLIEIDKTPYRLGLALSGVINGISWATAIREVGRLCFNEPGQLVANAKKVHIYSLIAGTIGVGVTELLNSMYQKNIETSHLFRAGTAVGGTCRIAGIVWYTIFPSEPDNNQKSGNF